MKIVNSTPNVLKDKLDVCKNDMVFCWSKNKVLFLFYQLVSTMYHKM